VEGYRVCREFAFLPSRFDGISYQSHPARPASDFLCLAGDLVFDPPCRCIESLAKTDIQGGFSNVPVILKLSSVWIGIFLGCLFLAVDAWSGLRRSGYHAQNQSMSSSYGQQGAGMYGQSKKGVLVVHLVVAILFFFLWLMTAIWTASTPGVGAQPLGVA
jgi:hypothetical protein